MAEARMLPKRTWSWAEYMSLKKGAYRVFMLREISCLFNALYMVFLIVMLHDLRGPKADYDAFLALLWSPAMLPLHVVALAFALLHTITFFNAMGKAIVIRTGEERISEGGMAVPAYAAWVVATLFVVWFLGHG